MDNNQNFIDTEKRENVSAEGTVSACQINGFVPTALNVPIAIRVPLGFRYQGTPITNSIAVDRHALKIVAYTESLPGTVAVGTNGTDVISTMVSVYHVRLIGVLYYNVVLQNLVPVKATSMCDSAVFNQSGSIPVDVDLGYVTSLADLQTNIIDNLQFNLIASNPTVRVNGEIIVFDPVNPIPFYQAFDGSDAVYEIEIVIVITDGSSPS